MQWTEITQDNVDELYATSPERIVIYNIEWHQHNTYMLRDDVLPTLRNMAKIGGYYYIELPELNTNENGNE